MIRERAHQKCLYLNGVNLLRVYYSVDIFGFEGASNLPVLRTFQVLSLESPPKQESPFTTRNPLKEEESYHIQGALLRATQQHLAVIVDYHSRVSSGIDEFDLVLLTDSKDLSRVMK